MSTIINTRSPYYIKYVPTGFPYEPSIIDVVASIYIYSGIKGTAKPTTPQYVVTKQPTEPLEDGANNFVVLEISSLIRDYIYTNYYEEAIDGVWVEVDAVINYNGESPQNDNRDFLAFDGFGLFKEGVNPRQSIDPTQSSYTPQLLQDNRTVYFVRGNNIKLPLFSEPEPNVVTDITNTVWNITEDFWNTTELGWDGVAIAQQITDSDDSLDKIQYLNIDTTDINTGDTITITSTVGNAQSDTIKIVEICDPKFTPYRIIFYNKYGALQEINANKKSVTSLRSTDKDYNVNIMDYSGTPSYSVNKHSTKRFNVEARQSIELNTDFVTEDLNDTIKQMLLSEDVWITDGSEVIPVIVKDSSFKEKTAVNDKLIQYTFNFDFAFEHIQNVR